MNGLRATLLDRIAYDPETAQRQTRSSFLSLVSRISTRTYSPDGMTWERKENEATMTSRTRLVILSSLASGAACSCASLRPWADSSPVPLARVQTLPCVSLRREGGREKERRERKIDRYSRRTGRKIDREMLKSTPDNDAKPQHLDVFGICVWNIFCPPRHRLSDNAFTATSVIVQGVVSAIAATLRVLNGGFNEKVVHVWAAMSVVVVIGAPVGSLVLTPEAVPYLRALFYVLAVVQLVMFGVVKIGPDAVARAVIAVITFVLLGAFTAHYFGRARARGNACVV